MIIWRTYAMHERSCIESISKKLHKYRWTGLCLVQLSYIVVVQDVFVFGGALEQQQNLKKILLYKLYRQISFRGSAAAKLLYPQTQKHLVLQQYNTIGLDVGLSNDRCILFSIQTLNIAKNCICFIEIWQQIIYQGICSLL